MHSEWVLNLVRGVRKVMSCIRTLKCWVCHFQEHLTNTDCQPTLESLGLRSISKACVIYGTQDW